MSCAAYHTKAISTDPEVNGKISGD
uniref:Uncharacterized protein n=1 Tax=Anguilla anguilla TaxID=7936 RepID=A0A0E9QX74_ANGAN